MEYRVGPLELNVGGSGFIAVSSLAAEVMRHVESFRIRRSHCVLRCALYLGSQSSSCLDEDCGKLASRLSWAVGMGVRQ